MIEVEKKFILTNDQYKKIKDIAEFKEEKTFTDVYYDTDDYQLTSHDVWFRKRDSCFELKLPHPHTHSGNNTNIYDEITDLKEIAQNLGIKDYLNGFASKLISSGYKPFCRITTARRTYLFDNLHIDVDEMDFGYTICEIEKLVRNTREIQQAEREILDFAKSLSLQVTMVYGKVIEYLKRNNPTHFQLLKSNNVIK
jgi:predicted adenylyl cyclase CyaB